MQTIEVSDSSNIRNGDTICVFYPNGGKEKLKVLAIDLGEKGKLKGNLFIRLLKRICIKIFKICPATWFEWKKSTTLTVERT
jgi:hypothetical protein